MDKKIFTLLMLGLLIMPSLATATISPSTVTQNANTTLTITITGTNDTNKVNGSDITLPGGFVGTVFYNTTNWDLTTDDTSYGQWRNSTIGAALGNTATADFLLDMASTGVGTYQIAVTEHFEDSSSTTTYLEVTSQYASSYDSADLKGVFIDVVGVVGVAVKDNAGDIVSMVIVGIIVSIAAVLLAQVFGIIDLTKFIQWGK